MKYFIFLTVTMVILYVAGFLKQTPTFGWIDNTQRL